MAHLSRFGFVLAEMGSLTRVGITRDATIDASGRKFGGEVAVKLVTFGQLREGLLKDGTHPMAHPTA